MTILISPATIDEEYIVSSSTSTPLCDLRLKADLSGLEIARCAIFSENDVEAAAYAIEQLRLITAQAPYAAYYREISPGPTVVTREELKNWARPRLGGFNHGQGTVRVGTADDPMGVLDEKMKMKGIDGLFVADNSVFPAKTSMDIQADATLAGEMGADFVLEYLGF